MTTGGDYWMPADTMPRCARQKALDPRFDLPRRIWFYLVVVSAARVSSEHLVAAGGAFALGIPLTEGDQAQSADARV